jgi:ABC-type uncharacterized transport system YnjBCD permease subunit
MVLEVDDHGGRFLRALGILPQASNPTFSPAQAKLDIWAMATFMSHIGVPIAIGAVAIVLLLGLVNMMRGGSPHRSQQLMRLRVLLQFIAIVVIMFTVWLMAK